jgi:hypothetical protein
MPSAEPPKHEGALALVTELGEALTATAAYFEAARHLDLVAETAREKNKLHEALDKSLGQLARAGCIFGRLRAALRDEGRAEDKADCHRVSADPIGFS